MKISAIKFATYWVSLSNDQVLATFMDKVLHLERLVNCIMQYPINDKNLGIYI